MASGLRCDASGARRRVSATTPGGGADAEHAACVCPRGVRPVADVVRALRRQAPGAPPVSVWQAQATVCAARRTVRLFAWSSAAHLCDVFADRQPVAPCAQRHPARLQLRRGDQTIVDEHRAGVYTARAVAAHRPENATLERDTRRADAPRQYPHRPHQAGGEYDRVLICRRDVPLFQPAALAGTRQCAQTRPVEPDRRGMVAAAHRGPRLARPSVLAAGVCPSECRRPRVVQPAPARAGRINMGLCHDKGDVHLHMINAYLYRPLII